MTKIQLSVYITVKQRVLCQTYLAPHSNPSNMAFIYSPLFKHVFILVIFLFFSVAHGRMGVIVCTEGCGCVTESGISVNCPFLQSNQMAVVQVQLLRNNTYRATRVIPIGTVIDVQIEDEEWNEYCPHAAGFRPRLDMPPICYSRPEKERKSPKPTEPDSTNCGNSSKECISPNSVKQISPFQFENCRPAQVILGR